MFAENDFTQMRSVLGLMIYSMIDEEWRSDEVRTSVVKFKSFSSAVEERERENTTVIHNNLFHWHTSLQL